LNPILSRFCEIFVPEYIENNNIVNLHQYNLLNKFDFHDYEKNNFEFIKNTLMPFHDNTISIINHSILSDISTDFYENGISCLDLMNFIENSQWWSGEDITNYFMFYYNIKSEYRCEKLILFYMLDLIYLRSNKDIKNILLK